MFSNVHHYRNKPKNFWAMHLRKILQNKYSCFFMTKIKLDEPEGQPFFLLQLPIIWVAPWRVQTSAHLSTYEFESTYERLYVRSLPQEPTSKTAQNSDRQRIYKKNNVCLKFRIYPISEISHKQRSARSWQFPCMSDGHFVINMPSI